MHSIWIVALGVLLVNLPFGYWRAGVRKFTPAWFVAVHGSVPLVAGLRVLAGLGWQLATFPLLVIAFVAGQFLGGRLRQALTAGARTKAYMSTTDRTNPTGGSPRPRPGVLRLP